MNIEEWLGTIGGSLYDEDTIELEMLSTNVTEDEFITTEDKSPYVLDTRPEPAEADSPYIIGAASMSLAQWLEMAFKDVKIE
jgi:hypothetical protein